MGPDADEPLDGQGLVRLEGLVDAAHPARHLTRTVDVVRLHVLGEALLRGGGGGGVRGKRGEGEEGRGEEKRGGRGGRGGRRESGKVETKSWQSSDICSHLFGTLNIATWLAHVHVHVQAIHVQTIFSCTSNILNSSISY